MMDYVRLFQSEAGEIVGSHQPNRPALVLYFGNIAMRGRAALHEELQSQIPVNYHSAIVEGAFCSADEAGDVPFLAAEEDAGAVNFGDYVRNWATPQTMLEAEKFLTTLLQQTTSKPIAVTMAALDVYLVVGNDGGACELWPTILHILSRPSMTTIAVNWHLVWMYRELADYQQPRDLPMYRLLKALENKNQTLAAVQAVPEVQAIPYADDAWQKDLSITIFSDRNAGGVCSDDVWKASCEAVAGYMLAHMFSSQTLPMRCTCAMYDAIYPDVFWSTGFQISAMHKLEAELQVREAAKMQTFLPMLADAWGIASVQSGSITPLLSNVLPTTNDLYMLPVNSNADNMSLRKAKNVAEAARLLYGNRFHQFFQDALESGPVAQLIKELTAKLHATVQNFNRTNGPYATAALLDDKSSTSLPALFTGLCKDLNYQPKLESAILSPVGLLRNPVDQRRDEVANRGGKEMLTELNNKALSHLFHELISAMSDWYNEYAVKAKALRSAFVEVSQQLSAVFPNTMLTYHQTVRKYADESKLYPSTIVDEDFQLLDRYFTVEAPAPSLMKTLAQLNVKNNSFITLTMQNAFSTLGYLNGSNDLKSALNAFCKAAVFSPVQYTQKDVYILPSGGDWSNGGRVYGLIRFYSMPNDISMLQSVSYLANLTGPGALTLQPGAPLPAKPVPVSKPTPQSKKQNPDAQPEPEPEKPIGAVKYNKPDTLLTFAWPQTGVTLLTMNIRGSTDFGETPVNQTITVSSTNYLTRGGAELPNVRLTGRCDVSFSWNHNNENHTSEGWLEAALVHISRIVVEKGKDYAIQITASENVPNLSRYLLLQIQKNNGSTVTYRLPELVDGEFRIDKTHCHGKPQIIFSDPKWNEYFSF